MIAKGQLSPNMDAKISAVNGVKSIWVGQNGLLSTPDVSTVMHERVGADVYVLIIIMVERVMDMGLRILLLARVLAVRGKKFCVFKGINYAKLANFSPILRLYSSFIPLVIYSVLGSLRHLAVGPVSIASLVMGTMLNEAVPYAQDYVLYFKLAFDATLLQPSFNRL
nr:probable sulfate transporter 3.4 [Tanacetum cinerariifolium]